MENINKTICDDETQLKHMNVRKSRFLQPNPSDGKQSILFRFAIAKNELSQHWLGLQSLRPQY
jgi:hypothetical protein